ncbi:hypothetical protein LY632_12855 [Erythrobacter sp. SDW2]|uniref:hypothetical protein n=1 Tax=Erythrobacter sp. SDW2 TaxID=2907154 RepID=UPI001F3A4A89|nr:hypothetical protein [Erythrobacter sp. SDW2]UIP06563.1 hypothetical protein LY632_12855 [Erythrobacter sp. SDW2]
MMARVVRLIFTALILFITFDSQAVTAQERTATRDGFVLEENSGKKILVFRPKVSVGAQSTGGIFEPNAEWTEQAKANIEASLLEYQTKLGNEIIVAPEVYGEDAVIVEEHMALFAAIADAVIEYQFFIGNRLPTKKRENKEGVFDWSLGPSVVDLPGADQADYALFIYNKDMYGSTGRKILQVVAILGAGIAVTSGEHKGYAGLVDLKTGDILWLNADGQMGGDVRDQEGSQKRVRQLLEEFPGSDIEEEK